MPGRNTVKQYITDGHYHIYNRGVEKRQIFLDDQDYRVFLSYLKRYLSPSDLEDQHITREFRDLSHNVQLIAFCLMPNHFHLLVKQISERGMADLMRGVSTRYSMYFNRKYDRVGGLFQGIYKAAFINQDEYFVHLSRYIHRNPDSYQNYPYSSYQYYLSRDPVWLRSSSVLELFDSVKEYKTFVESKENSDTLLGSLTLE